MFERDNFDRLEDALLAELHRIHPRYEAFYRRQCVEKKGALQSFLVRRYLYGEEEIKFLMKYSKYSTLDAAVFPLLSAKTVSSYKKKTKQVYIKQFNVQFYPRHRLVSVVAVKKLKAEILAAAKAKEDAEKAKVEKAEAKEAAEKAAEKAKAEALKKEERERRSTIKMRPGSITYNY